MRDGLRVGKHNNSGVWEEVKTSGGKRTIGTPVDLSEDALFIRKKQFIAEVRWKQTIMPAERDKQGAKATGSRWKAWSQTESVPALVAVTPQPPSPPPSSPPFLRPPLQSQSQSTELTDLITLAKIKFIDGYRKDETISLLQNVVTIGRVPENTISFPQDTQVSREHARIYQDGKTYWLDVVGTNGVLHNGEHYKQTKIPLQHGDYIQIGKTIMQFELFETPVRSGKSKQSRSHLGWYVGFVAVLVILGVGGFLWLGPGANSRSGEIRRNPPTPTTQKMPKRPRNKTAREQALSLLELGVAKTRQLEWKEALLLFQKASLLVPNHPEIQRRLQDTRAELHCATVLQQVRQLLQSRPFSACELHTKAWELLAPLSQQLVIGSVYAEELWRLQYRVGMEIKRVCRSKRGRYRHLIKKSKLKAAVAQPTAVLVTTSKAKDGKALFNGGQIDLAIGFFKKHDQEEKAKQVQSFVSLFRKGRISYNNRDAEEGISLLEQALTLDQQIGQGQSLYTQQIRHMLATLSVVLGNNAWEYKEDYASAYRYYQKAQVYVPRHESSGEKLRELEQKAQQLYKMALVYLKQNKKDVAKRLLRQSTQMISPTSSLYRESRQLLLSP